MHRINGSIDSQDRSSNLAKAENGIEQVPGRFFLVPSNHLFKPESTCVTRPVAVSNVFSGRIATRCVLKPIIKRGGKVYVN